MAEHYRNKRVSGVVKVAVANLERRQCPLEVTLAELPLIDRIPAPIEEYIIVRLRSQRSNLRQVVDDWLKQSNGTFCCSAFWAHPPRPRSGSGDRQHAAGEINISPASRCQLRWPHAAPEQRVKKTATVRPAPQCLLKK